MDTDIKNTDLRADQIEALETLVNYTPKLNKGIETVIEELSGNSKDDTHEYLRVIIDGINWVLGIINGCLDLVAECNVAFDKDAANIKSKNFSDAYLTKEDAKTAESLRDDVLPLIGAVTDAAVKTVAACR